MLLVVGKIAPPAADESAGAESAPLSCLVTAQVHLCVQKKGRDTGRECAWENARENEVCCRSQ